MKNFIIGFFLGGLLLGSASAVVSPKIVGGDGYLYGYEVVNEDGDELCSDPWVYTSSKSITCE